MKTVREILLLGENYLKERKIVHPKRVVEELIGFVLKKKRLELYMSFDQPIVEDELILLRNLLKRAATHEPLQYITKNVEFYGCDLEIDPRVLIPRPETEILVDIISKRAKKGVLFDLCTGSGCIGIALKKANPELEIYSSDLSKDAIEVAQKNAQKNQVEITFLQGDFFEPFQGKKADFIVINPPYVSEEEYEMLDPSVKNFEPKLSLVAKNQGLEFYQRAQSLFPFFLNQGGVLFFEIGKDQGEAILQLFPKAEIIKDYASHDRFVIVT